MPKCPVWLPSDEILTFEELLRVASLCAEIGVEKIRLSGGEPLMRRDLPELVHMLKGVRGIRFIGITTNGQLLTENAAALKEAGLDSVTISLQSLKPLKYKEITGGGRLEKTLAGIEAAKDSEFKPIKINCVVIRGFNDDEILDLASMAFSNNLTVRFIEFMPFDGQRQWGMDKVVSGEEVVTRIRKRYSLLGFPRELNGTARIYKFTNGEGEIGIISSVTEPFCSDCDRLRLTASGNLYACLFDNTSYDLRSLLRGGASDEALSYLIREAVLKKPPGVQTLLKACKNLEHVRPMYTIGG
jgi:cyclic pyranopterin phosphate synthase